MDHRSNSDMSFRTFLSGLLLTLVYAREGKMTLSRPMPSTSNPNERVVNGIIATEQYRKGLAQVFYKDVEYGDLNSLCSGSILGKRWILSAAHCFEIDFGDGPFVPDWFKYGVIPAAKFATQKEAKNHGIWVKTIWVHKKYKGGSALSNMNFDIALLELVSDIPNNRYKKVILSKPPNDRTTVVAAGYGLLNQAGESATHVMMTDMIVRKFEFCKKEEIEAGKYGPNQERMLCAVSDNWPTAETGVCFGDSGGPLFFKTSGEFLYQFASLSYSFWGCATYGGIDWYVNIGKYKWEIEQAIRGKANVFKSYPGYKP